MIKHGSIIAELKENRIIVRDENIAAKYFVNADEFGINELGNKTDVTWREAFNRGIIIIQNDDLDGHSWGAHGSICVREV